MAPKTSLVPATPMSYPPRYDGWVVGDEPFVVVDVSAETAEKFAKEEEAKGLVDKVKE
jgi:hypothetical protein